MKQQTAVEWLFENVWITPGSELPKILEQAKEMEREQLEAANYEGYLDGMRDESEKEY
jgi:hypothetical protein